MHAARLLQLAPPPGAEVVEVGTAVLDVLDRLAAAEVILALDAVQAGGAPGTVFRVDPAALAARSGPTSLHELDLLAAFHLLPPQAPRPPVIVLGVEPACIDYGLDLSAPVQQALPGFLDAIRQAATELLLTPA